MIKHSTGLKKLIKKRIEQGYKNYSSILKNMKGADPREVWNFYKELQPQAVNQTLKKVQNYSCHAGFPECHPAYSQWRLTEISTDFLLQEIEDKNYSSIAFLGCPVFASESKYPQNKTLVLDIDKSILRTLGLFNYKTREYDVNNELPKDLKGKFDCAISDPPWYCDDIKRFVARDSELVKEGGTIYFSTPGLLTKPSVPTERIDSQRWLSDFGLIISQMSERASYEVPAFEYMAYSDIPAFTGEPWRTGDWVKLKKVENKKPIIEKSKDKTKWLEYSINKKRIFLREKEDDGRETKLSTIYPNGNLILNTVSKRNPLVEKVDVWSSRNAVLHIDEGYGHVKEILEELSQNYNAYYGSRCPNRELLKMLVEV